MLAQLPKPVLFGATIIVLLMVIYLLQTVPVLVWVLVISMWAIIISSVLYEAGTYSIGSFPVLGNLVRLVATQQNAAQQRPNTSNQNAYAHNARSTTDRASLAQNAEQRIRNLLGNHPAIDTVIKSLKPQAVRYQSSGRKIFGAKRAWIGIIFGPQGVGKSSLAKALIDLFVGLDVINDHYILSITGEQISNMNTDWHALLKQGLDGVVLVDNGDGLNELGLLSKTKGLSFLEAVGNVAEEFPGRLCILITLNSVDFISGNNPEKILKRLTYEMLEFNELEIEELIQIFEAYLPNKGIAMPSNTVEKEQMIGNMKTMIKRLKRVESESFDNSEAMHRIADQISKQVFARGEHSISAQDVKDAEIELNL